jgi:hypothetical protein
VQQGDDARAVHERAVVVHDVGNDPMSGRPGVVAVPTYLLDGRVIAIGTPEVADLEAAICRALAGE